jgi:hypothetical protein
MNKYLKNYPEVSPGKIWNFRQNNPELVVQDAKKHLGLDEDQLEALRIFLLARGINKWLKVRRDIIKYKKDIQKEIKQLQEEYKKLRQELRGTEFKSKEFYKLSYQKNLMKARLNCLTKFRGHLKLLCMTDRWQIWPKSISRKVLKEMTY